MKPPLHLAIVAGEDSGDFHGANLVKALRRREPGIRISGIGGRLMQEAGVELVFDSEKLAVVGIFEVLERLPQIWRGRQSICRHLQQQRPDLLVLVDFPDFNLNLVAPYARRLKIPIIYYISPQVWAWRRHRVRQINRLVKEILVILPFEEEFYRRHGVAARYVGHPLLDEFAAFTPGPEQTRKNTIALIPGSRRGEIRRLLPLMLTAARLYQRRHPETRFIIPAAPSVDPAFIAGFIPRAGKAGIEIVRKPLARTLEKVSGALVASGTATLETALAEVPMIVVYKVNRISYELGRRLISVPFISLVNLIANEEVVPELIQHEARPEVISAAMRRCFDDAGRRAATIRKLRLIKDRLGRPGGADRAAEAILNSLSKP